MNTIVRNTILNTFPLLFFFTLNAQNCTNWLFTPSNPSYIGMGDLDVPGNQITVEANINSTAINPGGRLYAGDIVSKHTGPNNTNYLLRPNSTEITTTNGYFITPVICNINLNQTYHVAMVYDGVTLKFYRDGFLMSQVAATGNLYQNDLNTRVGLFDNVIPMSEQFLGYINEVRIWNVARTQAQIRTYMNSSLPNPTSQIGLLAYYTFDNLVNKQGNTTWNGTLMGNASINVTNPNCTFVADSCNVVSAVNTCNYDFIYQQNVCNPLSVQFSNVGNITTGAYWSFGDGSTSNGNLNPTHVYLKDGNYLVKYFLPNTTCADTLKKTITIGALQDDIILTHDTTICLGSTKQLLTAPLLNFCWSPTTYLNDASSPNPTTSATQNITYYLNAEIIGTNLIVNGDFSAGNTGFTSAYNFVSNNVTEGEYYVGKNPQAWNNALSNCIDHTTGTGNMMLVNGAPVSGIGIWKQTVAVTPNTNYIFLTWVEALWPPNPAILSFSINGLNVGNPITASLPTCTWTRFYTIWNSGNNTTATISLVNKNTFVIGNDFALDDIIFAPVVIKKDSISIVVEQPKITANNDTSACYGNGVQLYAIGGISYSWSPTTGLSNTNIPNPVATPSTNTQYIVTGTTTAGCTAKDSVIVTIKPSPAILKTNDTTLCHDKSIQLFASGGNTYSWLPLTGLSNPTLPNPIATPLISTKYYITVTGPNLCQSKDSVTLTILARPTFSVTPSTLACVNSSTQMNASGGDVYTWSPSSGLSDSAIANPIAILQNTTTYQVQMVSSVCNDIDTLSTTVSILPKPIINAVSANDIDCSIGQSQLLATGALQYVWKPTNGLNDSTINNPIASPTKTTTYVVTGKDQNGCTDSTLVIVNVSQNNKSGYYMPNAFTPNNDGLNDCFGIKYWGQINVLQFAIYNRFGKRLFYTENPSGCWDGTYNGQQQPGDSYVYYIKATTVCGTAEKSGNVILIR